MTGEIVKRFLIGKTLFISRGEVVKAYLTFVLVLRQDINRHKLFMLQICLEEI